jgi:hypothetical protein
MMVGSGRIRLVRPSAVIITHKKWVSGETLESFIHKDRPRNVGCVHHRPQFSTAARARELKKRVAHPAYIRAQANPHQTPRARSARACSDRIWFSS